MATNQHQPNHPRTFTLQKRKKNMFRKPTSSEPHSSNMWSAQSAVFWSQATARYSGTVSPSRRASGSAPQDSSIQRRCHERLVGRYIWCFEGLGLLVVFKSLIYQVWWICTYIVFTSSKYINRSSKWHKLDIETFWNHPFRDSVQQHLSHCCIVGICSSMQRSTWCTFLAVRYPTQKVDVKTDCFKVFKMAFVCFGCLPRPEQNKQCQIKAPQIEEEEIPLLLSVVQYFIQRESENIKIHQHRTSLSFLCFHIGLQVAQALYDRDMAHLGRKVPWSVVLGEMIFRFCP